MHKTESASTQEVDSIWTIYLVDDKVLRTVYSSREQVLSSEIGSQLHFMESARVIDHRVVRSYSSSSFLFFSPEENSRPADSVSNEYTFICESRHK